MLLKFSCPVNKLIRKQIKFTECFILNRGQEKYQFLNMCNLCRYAQFSQAQSHIIILLDFPTTYELHIFLLVHLPFAEHHIWRIWYFGCGWGGDWWSRWWVWPPLWAWLIVVLHMHADPLPAEGEVGWKTVEALPWEGSDRDYTYEEVSHDLYAWSPLYL